MGISVTELAHPGPVPGIEPVLEQVSRLSGLPFQQTGAFYQPRSLTLDDLGIAADKPAHQELGRKLTARNQRLETLQYAWRGSIFLPGLKPKDEIDLSLTGGEGWGEAEIETPIDADSRLYFYLLQALLLLGFYPLNEQELLIPEWAKQPWHEASAWTRFRIQYLGAMR